jgi:hypothetical protein
MKVTNRPHLLSLELMWKKQLFPSLHRVISVPSSDATMVVLHWPHSSSCVHSYSFQEDEYSCLHGRIDNQTFYDCSSPNQKSCHCCHQRSNDIANTHAPFNVNGPYMSARDISTQLQLHGAISSVISMPTRHGLTDCQPGMSNRTIAGLSVKAVVECCWLWYCSPFSAQIERHKRERRGWLLKVEDPAAVQYMISSRLSSYAAQQTFWVFVLLVAQRQHNINIISW